MENRWEDFRRISTRFYALCRDFYLSGTECRNCLIFRRSNTPLGSAPPSGISPLMAVAGTIELVGGIIVMFGLFAGFAAFWPAA